MRRLTRARTTDEGSVVAVVVVLLFVLLGATALVIDVGNLVWERSQLQNAADAAAFAAGQELIESGDPTAALEVGRTVAAGNSSREVHIEEFEPATTSVRVATRSGTEAQPTIPSIVAGAIGVDDYTSQAVAQAEWTELIGAARTLPFAVCVDTWERMVAERGLPTGPDHYVGFAGRAADAPPSPCTDADNYDGVVLLEHDANCWAETRVDQPAVGRVGIGGIDAFNRHCVEPTAGSPAPGSLRRFVHEQRVALVPLVGSFDAASGEADILGYAAFQVTGYSIRGNGPWLRAFMTPSECGRNVEPEDPAWTASCLRGHFVRGVFLGADPGPAGASPYGAYAVRLRE